MPLVLECTGPEGKLNHDVPDARVAALETNLLSATIPVADQRGHG